MSDEHYGVIKTLIPGWVHGEMSKLLNDMDGKECDVMVGVKACSPPRAATTSEPGRSCR